MRLQWTIMCKGYYLAGRFKAIRVRGKYLLYMDGKFQENTPTLNAAKRRALALMDGTNTDDPTPPRKKGKR